MRLAAATVLTLFPLLCAHAETVEVARAVVADHAQGRVAVVDLRSGRVMQRHDVASPAGLRFGLPGEITLAQGAAGRVDVLDTGIRAEGHGDHADLRLSEPSLRTGVAQGRGPRTSWRGTGGSPASSTATAPSW